MADSLAALDVHDGHAAGLDSGSLSGGGLGDQQVAGGGADGQRDAVHDSNDDRFFDATEDEAPEDAAADTAAHAQGPSDVQDAAEAVQSARNGHVGPLADRLQTAQAAVLPSVGLQDAPLATQTPAGSLPPPVASDQRGPAGSPGTPLPAFSPAASDLATVEAAAVGAASAGASEASFGPAAAGPPASASSIGLSVRSSVTFPSLAELASPVTPDFATQVQHYCLNRCSAMIDKRPTTRPCRPHA